MPLKRLVVYGRGDIDLAPLSKAPLTDFTIYTEGEVNLTLIPAALINLLLGSVIVRKATDLGQFQLTRLGLESFQKGKK